MFLTQKIKKNLQTKITLVIYVWFYKWLWSVNSKMKGFKNLSTISLVFS